MSSIGFSLVSGVDNDVVEPEIESEEEEVIEPIIEEPEVVTVTEDVPSQEVEETSLEIVSKVPRSDSGAAKKLSAIVSGVGASILSAFTGA